MREKLELSLICLFRPHGDAVYSIAMFAIVKVRTKQRGQGFSYLLKINSVSYTVHLNSAYEVLRVV